MALNDVQAIIQTTLQEELEIEPSSYKDHSVVLIIPDFHERSYVRDMVHMLIVSMGFKQICVQQVDAILSSIVPLLTNLVL